MARLESLPPEISRMILYNLGESMLSGIHASPHLRRHFMDDEQFSCRKMLAEQIHPRLFPLACALYHAEATTWKPNPGDNHAYTGKVVTFCQEYLRNPRDISSLPKDAINLRMMVHMLQFHGVVQRMVPHLGAAVGKLLPQTIRPNEWIRFARCIYLHELGRVVVPCRIRNGNVEDLTAWRAFWSSFAPWEAAGLQMVEHCIFNKAAYACRRTRFADVKAAVASCEGNEDGVDHSSLTARPFCFHNAADVTRQASRDDYYAQDVAGNIALQLGVRSFHLIEGADPLPMEFFKFSQDICREDNTVGMRASLWYGIKKHCLLWYSTPRRVDDILSIARRYSQQDPGTPLRIWMWSQIHQNIRDDSPLRDLVPQWRPNFIAPWGELRDFGFPYMGKCSFLDFSSMVDLRTVTLPTLDELIHEASTVAGVVLTQQHPEPGDHNEVWFTSPNFRYVAGR
ncbi:hypothetical protein F4818DRAFT_455327 [Hypoxylon cercidicola]|nr:hypothetical protein F4818DRAFT_455327 [Hypoxylon cercidicola]